MILKILKNMTYFIIIILILAACTAEKEILEPIITDTSKYNFESGLTDGWVPQTYIDSKAVDNCYASGLRSAVGNYSLCINTHLIAGSETKARGEVLVDMRKYRPFNEIKIPIDFNNKIITTWVYVPAILSGPSSSPNGIQIFLKDLNYYNWYSGFNKIGVTVSTNSWTKIETLITLTEGTNENGMKNFSLKDSEFDPKKIIILGVKIGTAEIAENVNVKGQFYVDSISWE